MKIRTKFFALIFGILLSMGLSFALYSALLSPVDQMDREKGYFVALSTSLLKMNLELSHLDSRPFNTQGAVFSDAVSAADKAFDQIDLVQALPKASPAIAEDVQAVQRLRTMHETRLKSTLDSYEALSSDAKALFGTDEGVTFYDFYTRDISKAAQALSSMNKVNLSAYASNSKGLSDIITVSIDTIDQQYGLINTEIEKVRQTAVALALSLVFVILVLTLILSIMFSATITGPILSIEKTIALLTAGDLTKRLKMKGRDEIGVMSRNLNVFLERLSASIEKIHGATSENVKVKDKLVDASTEAQSAVEEIKANSESIVELVNKLNRRVVTAESAINTIGDNVSVLNEQIEEQASLVGKSSSSLTEMLTSMDRLQVIAEKDKVSADELVAESATGKEVFQQTFQKIEEISKSIDLIREIAIVISDISSQTSILGMNAAIEAAHAGEFGKGFSVVAEEIRNLSEATSLRSREINDAVAEIISKIGSATTSSEGTTTAFEKIDQQIHVVSNSIVEIFQNLSNLKTSGVQVRVVVEDLLSRSAVVREGSNLIDQSTKSMRSTVSDVRRISDEVSGNIQEISLGISDIALSVVGLSENGETLKEVSIRLDGEVSQFRTLSAAQAS